ncbi:MAG: histidine phosphatase family protein [Thermomicrobiaceae bacterium]
MQHRRVHLVRHGVTTWNRERRYQGHINVPLSPDGERQAELTAHYLSAFPITCCFASDLSRAFDTARPIAAKLGISLEQAPDLREASKGELEGKYRDPETGLLGDESHFHDDNDIESRPPGGESMMDLGIRSSRFLAEFGEKDRSTPVGDVLLVSHGGTMRALLSAMLDMPIEASRSFHFDNCSHTVVQFRGELPPLLLKYNDTHHLGTAITAE